MQVARKMNLEFRVDVSFRNRPMEQKQRALRRAASAYIAQHRSRLEPRFSLITVEMVGTNVVDLAFVEDMM